MYIKISKITNKIEYIILKEWEKLQWGVKIFSINANEGKWKKEKKKQVEEKGGGRKGGGTWEKSKE